MKEFWVGFLHALRAQKDYRGITHGCGNGSGHGDAVIIAAVNDAAMKTGPLDHQCCIIGLRSSAQSLEHLYYGCNPIGLFQT